MQIKSSKTFTSNGDWTWNPRTVPPLVFTISCLSYKLCVLVYEKTQVGLGSSRKEKDNWSNYGASFTLFLNQGLLLSVSLRLITALQSWILQIYLFWWQGTKLINPSSLYFQSLYKWCRRNASNYRTTLFNRTNCNQIIIHRIYIYSNEK